jgi:GNAT superfamily N-acetyltransferase
MTEELAYRPPRPRELADCALIWHLATDDYMARLGRPLPPPFLDPLVQLLEHLATTDPEGFLIATRTAPAAGSGKPAQRVIGFGIGLQREHVWFLSQLYVLPAEQGKGVGRALLRLTLPSAPAGASPGGPGGQDLAGVGPEARPGVLATCTDSAQPIATGLYARLGIVPRMPILNLVGRPSAPTALPPLPAGVDAVRFGVVHRPPEIDAAIDTVDRTILGYAHSPDHAYLRAGGRTGYLYRTQSGEVLGYGYSSEVGRFGPVALLDETLTAPVLAHLLTAIEPRGAFSAWVPGANDRAMVAMLRAGLRLEGFPAMLCWTRPFADFDRYLPAGLALL